MTVAQGLRRMVRLADQMSKLGRALADTLDAMQETTATGRGTRKTAHRTGTHFRMQEQAMARGAAGLRHCWCSWTGRRRTHGL